MKAHLFLAIIVSLLGLSAQSSHEPVSMHDVTMVDEQNLNSVDSIRPNWERRHRERRHRERRRERGGWERGGGGGWERGGWERGGGGGWGWGWRNR